jgi:hypothetical protein
MIELGKKPQVPHVTCLPDKEMLTKNIIPTMQSGQESIMVWGAIAHAKKGPLI